MKSASAAFALLMLTVLVAGAQEPIRLTSGSPVLKSLNGFLPCNATFPNRCINWDSVYRIDVPADAYRMDVTFTQVTGSYTLYGQFGSAPTLDNGRLVSGFSTENSVSLARTGTAVSLQTGAYFFRPGFIYFVGQTINATGYLRVTIWRNANLSRNKTAAQSSTLAGYAGAGAASAVDGNTNGYFFANSVTHTNTETSSWWQVDLGSSGTINYVTIWNRTDCCASRLSNYWVFISDVPFGASDPPSALQGRAGTWSTFQSTPPGPSSTIAVGGVQGRYVRIQLSEPGNLSLAEVEVLGSGPPAGGNISLGRPASQSSTLAGYATSGAASAVDGNPDGIFFRGSVTHTNTETNPWWQVDLGSSATVNAIVIGNRTDCCGARMSDYWVFVSDTPFSAVDTPTTLQYRAETWASHLTSAPNPATTVEIPQFAGRYVRIQLNGTDALSLAEVQVLGSAPPAVNLALAATATQSSTLAGYAGSGAGSAIDGNTEGNFFLGSVTHTNFDANAWWQADLGSSTAIGSIAISNRTDCCGSRLSDYWVFVSSTPFGPFDTPATLQNRAGTWSSHQVAAPNPTTTLSLGTQGRYVRIQLTGSGSLSLAEVQILGGVPGTSGNLAQGRTSSQSSTLGGYPTAASGAAVDGNTNGNFFAGSVTHTNLEAYPWWQVDLGASATVNSVVINNRTDCCGDRLGDYWVFISGTPFGAGDTPATLQNRAGTFAVHQTGAPNPASTIAVPGYAGRYVRIQLNGINNLSLAEVQVTGSN